MKNTELVYFQNTHFEEYSANKEDDALANICIDGYPFDDNAEGKVIARVWITKHKYIVVDWHCNEYRMNDTVLKLIEDSKRKLIERF